MYATRGGEPVKQDGFGHERGFQGETNDWITPKWLLNLLGGPDFFDLDPCASETQPWPTAKRHYTVKDNGLIQPWEGNIFLNPPYGPHTQVWVRKLVDHYRSGGDGGIALIFARVETQLWQSVIFPTAHAYVFPRGRINFARPDGTIPRQSSGAPSALIAWGDKNRDRLFSLIAERKLQGAFFDMAFYSEATETGLELLEERVFMKKDGGGA